MRFQKISLLLTVTLLSAAAVFAKPEPAASALQPTQDEAQAAIWATRFLTRWHYKRVALDDAMSAEILDHYLDSVDGERLFFLQPDVDGFAKFKDKLDDNIYEGDLSPPFQVFDRYRQRVTERT